MNYTVLGIGYAPREYDAERIEWRAHGIDFCFAPSIEEAKVMLPLQNYICMAVRANNIDPNDIEMLRQVQSIPVIIFPPIYTAAERHACARFSAIQYIRASGHQEIAALGGNDSLDRYLEILPEKREPLIIITVKDLSFCLEYRSVEIRGQEIDLTEKEFDILALLIANQRKVFTYEMIMEAVWHEDASFYSPKAITTHISNLRKKLKTAPDVPEYIKSVRGIGYKFDTPK